MKTNPLLSLETEYSKETFKDLTAPNDAIAGKFFDQCVFINCSLREMVFDQCEFHDCQFQGCDLSLIKTPACVFVNTVFQECQLSGVNWTEAHWGKRFLKPLDFFNCVISYSTFFGVNLKEVNLTGCVAKDVDFSEADLTQANCRNTDFSDSRFAATNLTEADFTGATNYIIVANQNTLKRTKFSLPEAMSLLYSLDIILEE